MCETKAVVVSISLFLLVAASFWIYQAQTENKVGQRSKIKSQGPCENEYKNIVWTVANAIIQLTKIL